MSPDPEKNKTAEDGAASAAAEPSASLDWRLFTALRTRGHWRPLERALALFSTTGNWGIFWVGLALVLWLGGADRGQALILFLPVCVYLTLILNYAIKTVLKRERPVHGDPGLGPLVGVPSSKSFPSSHAAMSFAAATVLTYFYPPFFPLFYGLAVVMSWSRVYVGVHFPSDVVAGTIVGLASGGTAALFLNWF